MVWNWTLATVAVRKHPLALCEQCPLQRRRCAPSIIPPNPVAAVVSRSPGKYEVVAKKPFSGPSGKVLDNLLRRNGLNRNEVLLTNVVLCELPGNKVPPEAIKACAPRLQQELSGIKLVVAAGSEAVNVLCGRGTIDRYRGYRIQQDGRTVVATNNPALAIRDDSTFPNLKKDFKRAFNPNPPTPFPTVKVIEKVDDAKRYIERNIQHGTTVAADIESRGGLTHRATLISIQFSTEGTNAVVLGERQGLFENGNFLDDYLRPFLESEDHLFVWHNGKFDIKALRYTYGIRARVDHDTILLSYALDERSGGDDAIGVHGLEYLLMEEFGWPNYTSPGVQRTKKTGIVENYDEFYDYAGRDVGGTKSLFDLYYPLAERDNVLSFYQDILLPATNDLLVPAELHGIIYDVDRAADLYEFQVRPELDDIGSKMKDWVDKSELNPNSPTQISKILYDDWGVTHEMRQRPDKGHSVDDSARKEILAGRFSYRGATVTKRVGIRVVASKADDYGDRTANIRGFVELYDRHQQLAKQASTYLISLIREAESDEERRIFTDFLLFGTNSGRLSSRRPNLQNITRPKEGIPNIRSLFKASSGRSIVNADFSQAELRCIAQFSHDPLLWATNFYGENFTKHNRDVAKNVNFGVFYRQGAATFQEKHNIPEQEAEPYIDWIWRTFIGVAAWEKTIESEIHAKGTLVSPFGRKRRFHLLTEFNKQAIYREGINFYPQTTASDLTLTSAIIISRNVDPKRATVVLLVHDSILGDVRDSYIDEYKVICKQVMESRAKEALGWELPFKAETQVGPNWGEAK
jgi:uracil-DNA glycosylase family 4